MRKFFPVLALLIGGLAGWFINNFSKPSIFNIKPNLELNGWSNVLEDPKVAKKYTENYATLYRELFKRDTNATNPNCFMSDSVTRGVWFDKNVIFSVAAYLWLNQKTHDGIRFHIGTYDNIRADGQCTKKQFTLFWIGTKPSENGHADDWDFFPKMPEFKIKPMQVVNHGQLCPQKCD
jgi:hypothetical protein